MRAATLISMHTRLLVWSLRHHRARHLLAMVATAVTAAVAMTFVAVMLQLLAFARVSTQGGLVRILVTPRVVQPGSGTDGMPLSLAALLAKIDGVKDVQRKLVYGGVHDSGVSYSFFGEDVSGIALNTDIYPVDPAMLEAWKAEPTGAIVTETVAKDLRLAVGQIAELPSDVGPVRIKVVGITKGAVFRDVIGIHFPYMQAISKNKETCGYRVFAAPDAMDHVIGEIARLTKNSSMPSQGVDLSRVRADHAKRAAAIPIVLGFLGVFLMFTTGLTLANNTAISIRDRRVEVATLRVLGYKRAMLTRLLVGEAVIVGLLGGVLAAIAVTLAFKGGIALAPPELLRPTFIGPEAIVAGLAISIIVPVLGALPSAMLAVRIPIVDGLRHSA
jgi:putative ABC transport system permease protein